MGAWEQLDERLAELADLGRALSLMHWDMEVMMPAGGAPTRSRSIATLEGMIHERIAHPDMGSLIGELEATNPDDAEKKATLRLLRRQYDKATKVPADLVKELAEVTSNAYHAWHESKEASDFAIFQPHLERIVELKKRYADALGWETERYDALFDDYEPDMKASEVEVIFDELVTGLADVIDPVIQAAGRPPDWLKGDFDDTKRVGFCDWLAQHVGFDGANGRLDTSPHPFTIQVGPRDVRQTVQRKGGPIVEAVFTTLHETGHALYDQGLPEGDGPVADTPSLGIHESQSRLWENHVGRSRPFCEFVLPQLKERFPELGTLTPEEFFRGANHPERSLIRVEADELTYPLHIIVRFELELALFRDELSVADLPGAWDAAYEKHVGVRPPDHARGVLQDMHWSIGYLGYFPTYTLGTLYAAAFFAKANADLGGLDDDLRQGDCSRLLDWLRTNIHSKGHLKPATELARDVLGDGLSAKPFLEHVRSRYGELYDVNI